MHIEILFNNNRYLEYIAGEPIVDSIKSKAKLANLCKRGFLISSLKFEQQSKLLTLIVSNNSLTIARPKIFFYIIKDLQRALQVAGNWQSVLAFLLSKNWYYATMTDLIHQPELINRISQLIMLPDKVLSNIEIIALKKDAVSVAVQTEYEKHNVHLINRIRSQQEIAASVDKHLNLAIFLKLQEHFIESLGEKILGDEIIPLAQRVIKTENWRYYVWLPAYISHFKAIAQSRSLDIIKAVSVVADALVLEAYKGAKISSETVFAIGAKAIEAETGSDIAIADLDVSNKKLAASEQYTMTSVAGNADRQRIADTMSQSLILSPVTVSQNSLKASLSNSVPLVQPRIKQIQSKLITKNYATTSLEGIKAAIQRNDGFTISIDNLNQIAAKILATVPSVSVWLNETQKLFAVVFDEKTAEFIFEISAGQSSTHYETLLFRIKGLLTRPPGRPSSFEVFLLALNNEWELMFQDKKSSLIEAVFEDGKVSIAMSAAGSDAIEAEKIKSLNKLIKKQRDEGVIRTAIRENLQTIIRMNLKQIIAANPMTGYKELVRQALNIIKAEKADYRVYYMRYFIEFTRLVTAAEKRLLALETAAAAIKTQLYKDPRSTDEVLIEIGKEAIIKI